MAIDERLLHLPFQWAKSAQTNIPTPPVPGATYRQQDMSQKDFEDGQAYDKVYDSARYNQRDFLITGLVRMQEQYGILPWSSLTNYPEFALCLGLEDGMIYQAIKPSGSNLGGSQPTSNTEYWGNYVEKLLGSNNSSRSHAGYEIGEFYYFRHPKVREGFEPAQGGIIQRAEALYPEAWEYFQTSEGKQLCRTEDEWQAMTKATWATLADGTEVGFNGIGGAPFYVQDLDAGTLRLPDVRGMYAEAAGFDGLGIGGVHGDMVRNIWGEFTNNGNASGVNRGWGKGAFIWEKKKIQSNYSGAWDGGLFTLDISRVVPTGNANKPRAWGANACVYLGSKNT